MFEQLLETHTPASSEQVLPQLSAPAEESPDPRRYVAAVMRHRWWVLGLTAAGLLGGIGAARLARPSYQAQATVWIQSSDPRNNGGASRGPIGNNQLLETYAWVDLMRSYVVLDQVARDLRLYLWAPPGDLFASFATADEFRGGHYRLVVDRAGQTYRLLGQKGVELEHGTVGDSVGRALGFLWAPPANALAAGTDVSFTVRSLRDAAKGLADGLTVSIDQDGNFLRVSLTGDDGGRVAKVVNAVAHRYVEVATELKRAKVAELAGLLETQVAAARTSLQQAESAFDAFRVRTITLPADPAAVANGKGGGAQTPTDFFNLKLEQEQLARDEAAIKRVLAQAQDSAGAIGALAFIGVVQRSPDLDAALRELTSKRAERRVLRYGYTDDHPAVRRVTAEIDDLERVTIPALARALVADFDSRQRAMGPRIAAGSRELQEIPQRTLDEARLRRDLDMAAALYTGVQQRFEEARLAEASSTADVRVLDAAVAPQEPLSDRSSRMILLGLVAGLGVGVVGAVLVDRFDPRMRYPVQVTREMGLSILGVVPHVKDRGAGPDDEHVAHAIEAMRTVRLSVTHAYGPVGPMLFTITSPGSGDGKSLVSANLALAFAEVGQKTILVDGDVRRGALHHALHVSRRPGLTDFLAGAESLEAVTQATGWPSLDFIATGTRFRDSPELLASPAMTELVDRLRATYQVVLFDSPPLGAGVDPYTLGAATGTLLLVLRTGTTNLEFARTKLTQLDHLPIRLLGAIVNDVQPGGVYRHYSYLSGYGTADEGTALAVHRLRGVI